jgi:pantetheine-phosphate adenylyltransferase
MIRAIYAGSFDPFTRGHKDIITRSLFICDELYVAIGMNSNKTTMFSLEERMSQISEEMGFITDQIKVSSFQGLLVDYAKQINATILIRGIRSVADYEYETNLANINRTLSYKIETIFLPTTPELAIISSSAVKEIAKYGGDISKFVSKNVKEAVESKFGFNKFGNTDVKEPDKDKCTCGNWGYCKKCKELFEAACDSAISILKNKTT